MIFVTVGAQMPFDRLVRAVDDWAGRETRGDVFAQIGPSEYQPVHIRHEKFLDPPRFRSVLREASLVVAHAGMGSIISALEHGKPILVMPRRGDLAETRNDHQVATARRFRELGVVDVAMDEQEILAKLGLLANGNAQRPVRPMRCRLSGGQCTVAAHSGCSRTAGDFACPFLVYDLRAFIHGGPTPTLNWSRHAAVVAPGDGLVAASMAPVV